jgi:hypothetical protein
MTFIKFEHYVKLSNILHSRIYGSMNLSYTERTTDHWQATGKFYHFFVIFVTYKVEGEYKEV